MRWAATWSRCGPAWGCTRPPSSTPATCRPAWPGWRHGFSKYPDVKGSTLSTFGLSDYEWILGFEADSLDRLEGVLHHQRYTEARMHVRVDTPFYTGRRVSPQEWAQRQPWA